MAKMKLIPTVIIVVVVSYFAVIAGAVCVEAPSGKFAGISGGNNTNLWLGIPYAQATEGANRFRPPQSLPDSRTIFHADRPGPSCMQVALPFMPLENEMSENSLVLNIWAPKNANSQTALPVCVFIHGGGYSLGSGNEPLYNGASLAGDGNIVFVTINYRLGCEGFLYLAGVDSDFSGSGNIGLLDQIAALRWIKRNVAAFGGDPDNVTIMGESAGAGSVACLMVMPEAAGLFKRSIIESGGFQLTKNKSDAAAVTEKFMQIAGCRTVTELQGLSAVKLMQVQQKLMNEYGWLATETLFAPVCGDAVLPEQPLNQLRNGSSRNVDLLIGTNEDEMNLFKKYIPLKPLMNLTLFRLFVPQDALRQLGEIDSKTQAFYEQQYPELSGIDLLFKVVNDVYFHVNAYKIADAQSCYSRVYLYRFNWKGEFGAVHGLELPYVFGNLSVKKYDEVFMGSVAPDERVKTILQPAWLSFIRNGNPSDAENTALWAGYEKKYRPVMELGSTARLRCDPDRAMRLFWYAREADN